MLYRGFWSSRLKPQSISTTIRGIAFTLLGLISLMFVPMLHVPVRHALTRISRRLAIIFTVTRDDEITFDILLSTCKLPSYIAALTITQILLRSSVPFLALLVFGTQKVSRLLDHHEPRMTEFL